MSGKPRGFAAMDPELARELSSRGGKAVPREKRQFSRDRLLAVSAAKAKARGVRRVREE